MLHEIIARYTDLPVHVATDDTQVQVNHVYVLPADAILSIKNRRLKISRIASRRERKPIDIFFSALAVDLGELAVGIVLSGGDGDGTLGVKAIKERGGLTFAQIADGFGPQYPSMPESAISTGFVDYAISAGEMGSKLAEFASGIEIVDGIAELPSKLWEEQTVDQAVPEIYDVLRNQIGHDFSGYKTKTFMRRVQRRMQVTQLTKLDGYVERLRREPQEVNALFRDLLINVTNFFRDDEAFEHLARLVVPKLFAGRGADEIVRVWVPGCATGEEVFSIAMLLREHMDQLVAVPRVQIFATDIDERALMVARAARYPAALLDSVSAERRRRFFIADGGGYVISKDVRELCIFSPHSVIRDPPFSRIDLISCRNLLIYFGADVQNQVIPTFHYALRPDGYLFLGSAENVSQFEDLFAPVEKKHRIFSRRSDVAPGRLPILAGTLRASHNIDVVARRPALSGLMLRQMVDEHVLERFSPPHVVVNRDGDVVYYSNRTGKYLEAPAGAPTRQLLTMARKGLRLDLRTLFREAVESGQSVTHEGFTLEAGDDNVQVVNVTIEPMPDRGDGEQPLYLVLFSDQGPALSREQATQRGRVGEDGAAVELERELRETRDRLQSLIEEYETALEELKSSNEELVSVNEEMQSTNAEMEASKEELQSVNEELHTVNAELSNKVEALDHANADLRNLFESTNVATVFLDRDLLIRSFTPAVGKIFNILPSDRGRPITDLASRLNVAGLSEGIAQAFAGAAIERRVDSDDGATHYLVRIAPYRGAEQKIEGVVMSYVDVTHLTRAEARQRMLVAELQHRTRNMLATVQTIAQRTLGKEPALQAFKSRLSALGRVQSLVADNDSETVDLADLVNLELEALGAPPEDKITVRGPGVALDTELMQTFGLALHELATNAMKHGALAQETGRLEVCWELPRDGSEPPRLLFTWRESGVAMPRHPARGFGRQLIEQALTFTLRAKTELRFGPDGVYCRIEIPLPAPPPADR